MGVCETVKKKCDGIGVEGEFCIVGVHETVWTKCDGVGVSGGWSFR